MVTEISMADKIRMIKRDPEVAKECLKAYLEQISDLSTMVTDRIREINDAFKDEVVLTGTGIIFAINIPMIDEDLAVQAVSGVSCKQAVKKLAEAIDAENRG